jgi:hypothetical protein
MRYTSFGPTGRRSLFVMLTGFADRLLAKIAELKAALT